MLLETVHFSECFSGSLSLTCLTCLCPFVSPDLKKDKGRTREILHEHCTLVGTSVPHWIMARSCWKITMCTVVVVLIAPLCLTLYDPVDCSPPGSSVHGILQARILEWVAILFPRGSSWPRDRTPVSCAVGRFFTIWAIREAHMCTRVE